MSSESFQARRDAYHELRIDQLEHEIENLTVKLHDAETEVASLKLEIRKLKIRRRPRRSGIAQVI